MGFRNFRKVYIAVYPYVILCPKNQSFRHFPLKKYGPPDHSFLPMNEPKSSNKSMTCIPLSGTKRTKS